MDVDAYATLFLGPQVSDLLGISLVPRICGSFSQHRV